jgi:antitoxin component YwqK of YwqJK toxin-antitoxin module
MRFIITSVFVLLINFCHAQKMEQYYDYNWNLLNSEDIGIARYYTLIVKEDSMWHRQDYYIRERHLQMDGWYADSNCNIKQGSFTYFFSNGQVESVGEFDNSKKQGLWMYYNDNGTVSDSIIYKDDDQIGTAVGFYPNGNIKDSSFYNADGSGISMVWNDNGNLSWSGKFAARHWPDGKWIYYHLNGKVSSIEILAKGELITGQYFDENGQSIADTNGDRPASFPGGMKAWIKYIRKNSSFPPDCVITNGGKAVVVVSATIDENGKLTDIKITDPFVDPFNQIAIDMMKNAPNWSPEISHNRRVKYTIRQAITFVQQ